MPNDRYLVKAGEIAQMEGTRKVHFLNPNAQCTNKSLGDLTDLTGFGFHIMEITPGHDTTEAHFHYREDTDIVDYPDNGKRMFRTKGLDWNVVDQADIKDRKPM